MKKKKTVAKKRLDPAALEEIKGLLVHKYQELTGQLSRHDKQVQDGANAFGEDVLSLMQDFATLQSGDSTSGEQLIKIEEALRRIDDGKFGDCAECDKPIKIERLMLVPHAQYCVPCESEREKNQAA